MDNERIREFCLSLPHVTESVNWGHHLVFWVGDKAIGGKMFALIHLDEAGTGVLWFHCGAERYQELLETEGIIPAPYMAKAYWVTIERWDVLRQREFEDELRKAHTLVYEKLPKRTGQGTVQDHPRTQKAARRASEEEVGPATNC